MIGGVMKKIVMLSALIILLFSPAFARIHWVPSPHIATIQGGITIAKDGDTVLVMPGTYYENINFKGKNILVTSNFIFDRNDSTILKTIIDGNNIASVVTFNSKEDTTASITGFTITHGNHPSGGGIACINSSPKIEHNIIQDNIAAPFFVPGGSTGGGIFCGNSSAIIEYNQIINNQCLADMAFGFGGGISIIGKGTPVIKYNLITSNKVDGIGGGISVIDTSSTIIYNNTITNNYAVFGGGIYSCIFTSNAKIYNNIIAFNSDGIRIDSLFGKPYTPILIYNDFWGNYRGNFLGFPPQVGDTTWGFNLNGVPCDSFYNITRNPLFVDTANFDFHLLVNSPCIDAGDPFSPLDPDTTIADMGAFYYPHTQTFVKDNDRNLPVEFELSQNYPNPFNPATTIPFTVYGSQFTVHSPIHTTLKIYNIKGQLVKTLVDEEKLPGNYNIIWDGKENSGREVSSGIYFYQLKTMDYTETRKMVLLR
jgi:parallel beta-helix repeat protein